jgi:hypothetical protein
MSSAPISAHFLTSGYSWKKPENTLLKDKGFPSTGFFLRRMPVFGILHFKPGPAMNGSNRPGDIRFGLSELILALIF